MMLSGQCRSSIGAVAFLLFALVAVASSAPPPFNDVARSLGDVAGSVFRSLPRIVPSADDIFSASKNLIAGYPAEALLSAVNVFCNTALSSSGVNPKTTPAMEAMNFVLMTRTDNHTIPLREPEHLWHHPRFNRSRPTAVIVTGWTSNVNKSNSALDLLYEAYMCRGGFNVVAIDTAEFVDTLYEWAALNTNEIGKHLAAGLHLLAAFYPIDMVHLIGHSLGAHIAGSAGRNYAEQSGSHQLLPRITGLDPANPCFNEGNTLNGLARGDARFVDVIHSNPGALGKREALGDVDFYPNGKQDPLPPGCVSIGCAHGRAYEYFAETVYPGNENAFPATKCNSMFALSAGFCKGSPQPMGMATPATLKGEYYLRTNSESPFGEHGTKPDQVVCNEEDGSSAAN